MKARKAHELNSNIFLSLLRGIGLGATSFWRNKILSIATVVVIAVILFIFNVILTVHFIGNQALRTLSERVDIVIYLKDDISYFDAKNISEAIQRIDGVKTVKYTSKEEALNIVAKTHPQTAEFLRKFKLDNPLPPSVSIITEKPEDFKSVEAFLQQGEYKSLMKNYIANGGTTDSLILSNIAKNLSSISNFVRQIIFWLVMVFIIGGTLVIVNAVQLTIYTRRSEIYIMRLVGATPNFIRLPFLFEGILYCICAVILSFIFLLFAGRSIQLDDSMLINYYQSFEFWKVFIAELLISIFLGTISSFTAVEQYIKGKLQTH